MFSTYFSQTDQNMSTPMIYITRRIHDQAIGMLREKCKVTIWNEEDQVPRAVLLQAVKGVDAIFCTISDIIDKEVLDAAGPQLKTVATMSVGKHHIAESECTKRNIYVANTPDVATDSTAELTITLLLITARRCMEGARAVETGEWGLWKPMWICGTEMSQRTVGILGFGRVGYGVARRIKPFGVKRILFNDLSYLSQADDVNAEFVDQDTLFKESDFLIICTALNVLTKKLINKDTFKMMKPTAILINTSRGPIVDTEDLVDALRSGQIAAAGLDVTDPEPLPKDHPLIKMDNCIVTPHIGTNTTEARRNMAVHTAKNILAIFRNGRMI